MFINAYTNTSLCYKMTDNFSHIMESIVPIRTKQTSGKPDAPWRILVNAKQLNVNHKIRIQTQISIMYIKWFIQLNKLDKFDLNLILFNLRSPNEAFIE